MKASSSTPCSSGWASSRPPCRTPGSTRSRERPPPSSLTSAVRATGYSSPGHRSRAWWLGAVTGPLGLGLSIVSYAGQLSVGLVGDAHLVPDHDRLLALIDEEVGALRTPTASSSPPEPGADIPGAEVLVTSRAWPCSRSMPALERLPGDIERTASIERSLPGAPSVDQEHFPEREPPAAAGLTRTQCSSRGRPGEDGDEPTVEVIASSELATERGRASSRERGGSPWADLSARMPASSAYSIRNMGKCSATSWISRSDASALTPK